MMRIATTQLHPEAQPDTYVLTYVTSVGDEDALVTHKLIGFTESDDRDILEKFVRALTAADADSLATGTYEHLPAFMACFAGDDEELDEDVLAFLKRTKQECYWQEDFLFEQDQMLHSWEVAYHDHNSVACTAFITLED